MTQRQTKFSEIDDADEYLQDWAIQLADSLSPDELQSLLRDYRRTSRNKMLSKEERRFARRRAKAISETL